MRTLNLSCIVLGLVLFVPLVVYSAQSVRIGYFANITHAQALVGKANGTFEKHLGENVDWKMFNAGPTALEALLSGSLDIAYVGPNPALNAYVRSGGKALRIIAGAAGGGASLVVRQGENISWAIDLKGKRVASPEFGNTQDIALRSWLISHGLRPGRDLQVMPVKNAEILDLFMQKRIAAAWVPEPWVSRLVHEAGGRILLDERSLWPGGMFPTAVLVARADFLAKNRDTIARIVAAHLETTQWINSQPVKAKKMVNSELARVTRRPLSEAVINDAFSRLVLTYDPGKSSLLLSADKARDLGFLPKNSRVALDSIFDLETLNSLLRKNGLKPIK